MNIRNANAHKYQIAFDLFTINDRNLTDIAEAIDMPRQTVSEWCDKYKWREVKEAMGLPDAVVQGEVNAQLKNLQQHIRDKKDSPGFPNSGEADIQSKLIATRKSVIGGLTLSQKVDALDDFTDFVKITDKETFNKVVDLKARFIAWTAEQMEKK